MIKQDLSNSTFKDVFPIYNANLKTYKEELKKGGKSTIMIALKEVLAEQEEFLRKWRG